MDARHEAASREAIEAVRELRQGVVCDADKRYTKYEEIVGRRAGLLEARLKQIAERHNLPFATVLAMPFLYLGLDRVR